MKTLDAHDIVLEEPNHRYRLIDGRQIEFTSCTEFINGFFEPFDAHAIASKLVEAVPVYRGRTVSSLLKEWDQAERLGTEVHTEISQAIQMGETQCSPLQHHHSAAALAWLRTSLPQKDHIYHTECHVYSESLRLAGTIDLCAIEISSGKATVVDWKTNKRIDRTAFRGKRGIRGPAQQLEDCHFVKYGLQLSLYAHLLEREYGINASALVLVHLSSSGQERIDCPDSRQAIKRLIDFEGRT